MEAAAQRLQSAAKEAEEKADAALTTVSERNREIAEGAAEAAHDKQQSGNGQHAASAACCLFREW